MITLRARAAAANLLSPLARSIYVLVGHGELSPTREASACLIADGETPPPGYPLYLVRHGTSAHIDGCSYVELPESLSYLTPGDVLALSADGERLRVKWRQ